MSYSALSCELQAFLVRDAFPLCGRHGPSNDDAAVAADGRPGRATAAAAITTHPAAATATAASAAEPKPTYDDDDAADGANER